MVIVYCADCPEHCPFVSVTRTHAAPAAPAVTFSVVLVELPLIVTPLTVQLNVLPCCDAVAVYVCVEPAHTLTAPLTVGVGIVCDVITNAWLVPVQFELVVSVTLSCVCPALANCNCVVVPVFPLTNVPTPVFVQLYVLVPFGAITLYVCDVPTHGALLPAIVGAGVRFTVTDLLTESLQPLFEYCVTTFTM